MVTKVKENLLSTIQEKEQKILVSNVIDKAIRYSKANNLEITNFLDLYELSICTRILNSLKIDYNIIDVNNKNMDKKNIAFIPDYMDMESVIKEKITCIKIIPNNPLRLTHRDYMGAVYNLGIKRDYIGDIFSKDTCAYVFVMSSIKEYVLNNLFKVSNQNVLLEEKNIFCDEVKYLNSNFVENDVIIASLRVDAILSSVYKLSRNKVKEKISKSDLFINCKNVVSSNMQLKENDVVSFKKCGKLKIGRVKKTTRSGSKVLSIKLYN